jgi:hypothetical protein
VLISKIIKLNIIMIPGTPVYCSIIHNTQVMESDLVCINQ